MTSSSLSRGRRDCARSKCAGPARAPSCSAPGRRIAGRGDLRPHDRPSAPCRASAGRPAPLVALHRRPRAEGRAAGGAPPQRRRESGDDRRPRGGDQHGGGSVRDRARLPGCVRGHRALQARLRRQRQADGIGAQAWLRALSKQPAHRRGRRCVARELRAHRHGGLVDHQRHAAAVSRVARRGPCQCRDRPAGDVAPDAWRHRGTRGPEAERPDLQRDLRRVAGGGVSGLRGGACGVRPRARGAARRRLLRGHRDARRVAPLGGATRRRRTRAETRRLRVPDAARRQTRARRRARSRRAPLTDLRAVRSPLVCVLAAATAGKSAYRRLHRRRHVRPVARAQRRLIWARADGCRVWDEDGREYIDLTGGFGVAVLGHGNARIREAVSTAPVVHALGDLADAEVTQRLRDALPWPAKFGVTGEDAVEIALRTALLHTGKPGIAAFEGAYHGTVLLALAATGLEQFREPFAAWLPGPVHRHAYGEDPGPLPEDAACVIVEPVQGRAGSRVPPDGFLKTLRRRCDEAGAVLVVDSIFAGLGRVGEMWPGEQVADVLCVGKALGGGLPLSAALFYRDGLEDAWHLGPEDVYTHTHVGNPLACAAGLVVLDEVPQLLDRVREAGERFEQAGWHGRGLLRARAGDADEALARGVLVVPAGPDGSLIPATPPLTITDAELDEAFERLS